MASAQGVVQFQNGGITFPTLADRLIYADRPGGTGLTGTNFAAALSYAPGAGQNLYSPTAGTPRLLPTAHHLFQRHLAEPGFSRKYTGAGRRAPGRLRHAPNPNLGHRQVRHV